MLTEDQVGRGLRTKTLTVDDAVRMFQAGQVVVYPEVALIEGAETWQEMEHANSGSTLFADLAVAGASDEQQFEVGAQIEAARAAGRTTDKVFPTPDETGTTKP